MFISRLKTRKRQACWVLSLSESQDVIRPPFNSNFQSLSLSLSLSLCLYLSICFSVCLSLLLFHEYSSPAKLKEPSIGGEQPQCTFSLQKTQSLPPLCEDTQWNRMVIMSTMCPYLRPSLSLPFHVQAPVPNAYISFFFTSMRTKTKR